MDNEEMNRKKSKCCCIYVKPREFGESSSESEDECEHCFGHVEGKHKQHDGSVTETETPGPSHLHEHKNPDDSLPENQS